MGSVVATFLGEKIGPHLLDNWGKYVLLVSVVGALGGAKLYYDNEISAAEQRGRAAAISECNTVQLEEELRAAVTELEQSEKRNTDLLTELESQRTETEDQREAFRNLEMQLEGLQDGALSERTIRFVEILSQRSAQYQTPNE